MSKDGGPAFPLPDNVGNLESWKYGMSLRDWFAGMAMQGIVTALHAGIRPVDVPRLAEDAYGIADFMIVEHNKDA